MDYKKIESLLKYKDRQIFLKGSASDPTIIYYGDYDFFTTINKKESVETSFNEFKKIYNNIVEDKEALFIEFKIQTKKNEKIRWYNKEDFNIIEYEKVYKQIDFCKIDIVYRLNYKFMEASCIYKFELENAKTDDKKKLDKDIKSDIKSDIKELLKEKNYYKVLKREYLIYKIDGNNEKTTELKKIFNSELGKIYMDKSNLEAILLVLEHTDDKETILKVKQNLKLLGLEPNIKNIDNTIKKYKKILNAEAKKIYQDL